MEVSTSLFVHSAIGILFSIFLLCIAADRPELIEKVRQLNEYSAKNYLVKLNNAKFREYIKTPLKNYSFVILFAAMDSHRQCSMCDVVYDEFELTAKSFRLSHDSVADMLFFGFVDFDQNIEIFHSMNVKSVPVIIFFSAKQMMRKKTDVFDMQRHGYTAESMAKWLTQKTDIQFHIIRQPLFFGTAGLLALFFLGSIVIFFKCENFSILNNRTLWSILAVAFCLLMTSGQIWNHIRGPPFITRSAKGGLSYVHATSHGQFIGETYAVFMLNAGITVSVIVLIDYPYSDSCLQRNKIMPLLCTVAAALFFNGVLSIFKIKASNYPYKGLL